MPTKQELLLDKVRKCVGNLYVIGGQGHEATESYIRSRAKAEPSYFTGGRLDWMIKRIKEFLSKGIKLYCWDCSGLFWDGINKANIEIYDSKGNRVKDKTANDTYKSFCTPIKKSELQLGDLLFYGAGSRITHMAIVGEQGRVYEACGGAYGVIVNDSVDDRTVTNLMTAKQERKSAWNYFGRPKVFIDSSKPINTDGSIKKGDKGQEVKEYQQKLINLGYSMPKFGADGDYGDETVNAVKSFQKDNNLDQTGIIDKATKDAINNSGNKEQAEPETQGDIFVCTGGTVNVRSGPGTQYEIIGTAKKDQIMLGGEQDEGWRQIAIMLERGLIIAYISEKYIKVEDAATAW